MDKSILSVENLSKNFGGVAAIVHVSFSLREGELLGIIGPNGSGKSTLSYALMGHPKYKIERGRIIC
jgi:ABC-type branched-subunit amino acid transport system ATPase component